MHIMFNGFISIHMYRQQSLMSVSLSPTSSLLFVKSLSLSWTLCGSLLWQDSMVAESFICLSVLSIRLVYYLKHCVLLILTHSDRTDTARVRRMFWQFCTLLLCSSLSLSFQYIPFDFFPIFSTTFTAVFIFSDCRGHVFSLPLQLCVCVQQFRF